MKPTVALHDLVPAAWDGRVQQTEGDQRAADHKGSLDDVCPDDGFDSTQRCVNRCQKNNRDGCSDVDEKCFSLIRPHTSHHFVGQRKCDCSDIQPRAGREHAGEKENG